jgi:hypothetical protein
LPLTPEGEVIGRELLDYFEWTGNINRLWLTALDDNSIKKALNSLKQGSETEPLYAAGLAAKSLLRQCPFSSENSSLLNHHLASTPLNTPKIS